MPCFTNEETEAQTLPTATAPGSVAGTGTQVVRPGTGMEMSGWVVVAGGENVWGQEGIGE